jgi:membrane-bound lytic murein transglycosylase A
LRGFFGQVHHTISTASARASATSRYITHICLILAAAACTLPPPAPKPETARYVRSTFDGLPGWRQATLEPSLRAFLAGCPKLQGVLASMCQLAPAAGDEAAARAFFESRFVPYALVSSEGALTNLITGYYEPIIAGSREPGLVHRHPVFGLPEDLVVVDLSAAYPELRNLRLRGRLEGRRVVPYYSRAEIEARGKGFPAPVIAWVADPVELFFLQIQGSGQIEFKDGTRTRIGYADQNGHPYRSLGRYLIERGEMTLEQASMQGIQAWAAANPQKLQEALNANPSYVFFRELNPAEPGPIGALGVPLSAQYSLAVDRRFVPLGAPVYLATTYPLSEHNLERLMAAQDTGGAIRGVARGDFFWGTGSDAGALAGRMRQQGRMWLLWPRDEPPPGN